MGTCHTAAVIACRVMALYLAISSFIVIPGWMFQVLAGREAIGAEAISWAVIYGFSFSLVAFVAIAVALWMLAPWLARRMLTDLDNRESSLSTATVQDVHTAAISVLGLYFCVAGAAGMTEAVARLIMDSNVASGAAGAPFQSMVTSADIRGLILRATEFALGAWLFLGARGFVRLFTRLNRRDQN